MDAGQQDDSFGEIEQPHAPPRQQRRDAADGEQREARVDRPLLRAAQSVGVAQPHGARRRAEQRAGEPRSGGPCGGEAGRGRETASEEEGRGEEDPAGGAKQPCRDRWRVQVIIDEPHGEWDDHERREDQKRLLRLDGQQRDRQRPGDEAGERQ